MRTELVAEPEARVEIRQLEELEMFDSLRLSIVVTTEIIAEILAEAVTADILADVTADVLADIAADILTEVLLEVLTDVAADVAGRTELEARVEIQQPKELKAEEFKMFSSLRLSVVFATEVLVKLTGGTELI